MYITNVDFSMSGVQRSVLHHLWYFSKIISNCWINKVTVNHCYYIYVGPVACKQCLIPWRLTDTIKRHTAVRTCLDVWLWPLSMVKTAASSVIWLCTSPQGSKNMCQTLVKSLPEQLTTRHGKCPTKTPKSSPSLPLGTRCELLWTLWNHEKKSRLYWTHRRLSVFDPAKQQLTGLGLLK